VKKHPHFLDPLTYACALEPLSLPLINGDGLLVTCVDAYARPPAFSTHSELSLDLMLLCVCVGKCLMGRQAVQGSLSPAARPKGYLIVSVMHACKRQSFCFCIEQDHSQQKPFHNFCSTPDTSSASSPLAALTCWPRPSLGHDPKPPWPGLPRSLKLALRLLALSSWKKFSNYKRWLKIIVYNVTSLKYVS
jgi:hypothetical protein